MNYPSPNDLMFVAPGVPIIDRLTRHVTWDDSKLGNAKNRLVYQIRAAREGDAFSAVHDFDITEVQEIDDVGRISNYCSAYFEVYRSKWDWSTRLSIRDFVVDMMGETRFHSVTRGHWKFPWKGRFSVPISEDHFEVTPIARANTSGKGLWTPPRLPDRIVKRLASNGMTKRRVNVSKGGEVSLVTDDEDQYIYAKMLL